MRFVAWVFVLALVLWACAPVRDSKPDCDDDELLCPTSKKTATRVACNCECQLPRVPLLSGVKDDRYRGKLIACLPTALNPSSGTPAERQALKEMPQGQYNQRVFKFCSENVAEWLSLTIKSQLARFEQVPAGLACQPHECTCSTEGATVTYPPCDEQCEEKECDRKNCQPILRRGGILDVSSCYCTRTKACGFASPPSSKPGLCRPLVGVLDPSVLEDTTASCLSLSDDVQALSREPNRCE